MKLINDNIVLFTVGKVLIIKLNIAQTKVFKSTQHPRVIMHNIWMPK